MNRYEQDRFEDTKNQVSSGIFYVVFGFLLSTMVVLIAVYFLAKQVDKTRIQLDAAAKAADGATEQITTFTDNYSKIAPEIEKIFDNETELNQSLCLFLQVGKTVLPNQVGGRALIDLNLDNCLGDISAVSSIIS